MSMKSIIRAYQRSTKLQKSIEKPQPRGKRGAASWTIFDSSSKSVWQPAYGKTPVANSTW